MYAVSLVSRLTELQQIALLSKQNLRSDLSEQEKQSQGFITWEYTLPLLEKLHAIAPSVIVKYGEEVVGYALTARKETSAVLPILNDMIHHLESLSFNGKPLKNYRYYVMGQICIAKAHRGKGLFDQLYQHHKKVYSAQYELLVTEISTSNHRSRKAHQNTGFQTIHTYLDEMDEWDVVVWNWQ